MDHLLPALFGLTGLALGMATLWARRGTSEAARAWAAPGPRVMFAETLTLAVAPLCADTMVLGAASYFADPLPPLKWALALLALAAYVAAVVYAIGHVFGLRAPYRVQPLWWRLSKRDALLAARVTTEIEAEPGVGAEVEMVAP